MGDIDFAQRSVRIERSVSATTASGVSVKTTKTGGVRRVTITAQAIGALHAQHERAETYARRNRRSVAPDDFIFTNDPAAARPWRPELATRRWERLRRERVAGAGERLHGPVGQWIEVLGRLPQLAGQRPPGVEVERAARVGGDLLVLQPHLFAKSFDVDGYVRGHRGIIPAEMPSRKVVV